MAFDVDGGVSEPPWPSESIPDDHLLYCRVHQTYRGKSGRIAPSAFVGKKTTSGTYEFSTDWCQYSTPEQTRDRARNPRLNGVYQVRVGALRAIDGETVVHTPIQNHPNIADNRAHADVIGRDHEDPEIKRLFSRIYDVVIPVP